MSEEPALEVPVAPLPQTLYEPISGEVLFFRLIVQDGERFHALQTMQKSPLDMANICLL